jgi:ABC-type dipeptide/oligopeptide/nickel transport system permease subunit
LISGTLGVFLGLIAGFYGGKLDTIIMRMADIQLAFPFILLVIALVAVLGTSLSNVIAVFGIAGWVIYARTTRGIVLSLKEKEFVEAARALGLRKGTILFGHIFPNTLSPLIVIATTRVAQVIIWESGLSFLGLGVPPPIITWGRMLADGRPYLSNAWWCTTFPGLAIMVVVLGVNLLGDGIRDALDPRLSSEKV